MRTIRDIYTKYTIPVNLEQHMFRVTAVAEMIMDHGSFLKLDRESVIAALLIHDLGNIVKFKLDIFPQFLEPQGRDYWEKIQAEFREKYGYNDHRANVLIAQELGVSQKIVDLVDKIDLPDIGEIIDQNTWEQKICNYADLRAGPFGVLSLDERLSDGRKRYAIAVGPEQDTLYGHIIEIERQIFSECQDLKPSHINDESIRIYMEKYPKYQL